jgi:hypothetical protein
MVAVIESEGVEFDTPEVPFEPPKAPSGPEVPRVPPSVQVFASALHGLTVETIGRPLN